MQNKYKRRQIDNKPSVQVRIDAGLHYLLRIKAANDKCTLKAFVEQALAELLGRVEDA